ncbi:MAG: hydroxyacid dehydrogenase [Clostridia bacterium]|nr:hydroxyacid dehydrogenase [Clostridia bacterium]
MKIIFLTNEPSNIRNVYPEKIKTELAKEAGVSEILVVKGDELESNKADMADAEYAFSTWGMPQLTEEQIAEYLPSLKAVFYGAGSVQYFARPFLNKGIKVFSAWAANAVPVAEYTVAEIVLSGKGVFTSSRLFKEQGRDASGKFAHHFRGNYGAKVGLIGAGMIGSLVAEMLKAYRFEVLVFDPFLSAEKAEKLGVKMASLEEIFSQCQVVSNHLANNPQTVGMLDYKLFSLMGDYTTFINTGRGAQVVEADLIRAMKEKPTRTALLDVTFPEPPEDDSEFYTLPNVILTPHSAGSMSDELYRMSEYMLNEYRALASGEPTKYEVTLKMLETMA